jgi:nitrogen fixation NifU-like protein
VAEDLYQDRLVAHAKAARGAGRLPAPDATHTADNPLCGDRVTVDVRLAHGRVAQLSHHVRGCLLCEAAASVLGARAVNCTPDEIATIGQGLMDYLKGKAEAPPASWPELADFAPVRAHRSRFSCVALPFEAALRATAKAAAAK